ncbi:MAG: hypothetical protein NTY09_03190, partial [bacterium]|nr:hypothetical protein [bacterium]
SDGICDDTGENVDHTWDVPGTYLVQLRVPDDEGQVDIMDFPLQVEIAGSYDGNLIWAKHAGGENSNGSAFGYAITTLSENSIVVTGVFEGSATFGLGEPNKTVLTAAGLEEFFIARYDQSGTLVWATSARGISYDYGSAITALSDDSVVVAGQFFESATFGAGEPNETVLNSTFSYFWNSYYNNIFIARYNPDGTLAWAKSIEGGPEYYGDQGFGISTLSDNSFVLTGYFYGSAKFGPGEPNETVLFPAGVEDIFIARYNPDGTLSWVKQAGGDYYNGSAGITTLSDDSTVVTGQFWESATFGAGEPNETVLNSAGYGDIFIARYNPDGTLAWAKGAGGANDDYGYGITTLSDTSTVVTGYFEESATFGAGEQNETVLTSAGYGDIFIARYSPDGTLGWAKCAGGADYDNGNGITTLSDNSTIVTGFIYDTATFGPGEPNETVLTSAYAGTFIARYNPDGTLKWAKQAGGIGYGITMLSDDTTVVTGYFYDEATFGPGEPNETVLIGGGYSDIFVARFAP